METHKSRDSMLIFSRKPCVAGMIAVLVGLSLIIAIPYLTQSPMLKELLSIAGLALVLVGVLAYGFGLLVRFTHMAPDNRDSGPTT